LKLNFKENEDLFEFISCPICGAKTFKPISKKGQFGFPCHVSICKNDGLVLLNPRWTKERYSSFYAHEYDSYYRPKVFTKESDRDKYSDIIVIFRRFQNFGITFSGKHVLDIGAGMGWSLEWIKRNFPNFTDLCAIESSMYCINNIVDELQFNVISQDIESDWKSPNTDLIIMRHVLEHFLNPLDILNNIARNLSENGVVYIAVPNMFHPRGSLSRYWFRVVHTFYFSEFTLMNIILKVGLYPVIIKSNTSELWGIFRKQSPIDNISPIENAYKLQYEIIENYKFRSLYHTVLDYLFSQMKLLVPSRILNGIKLLFIKINLLSR
jgi:2-polyprenyl-3-methyl-5-hydroxy-6-metoxy-1,4-benzoquinol methylase